MINIEILTYEDTEYYIVNRWIKWMMDSKIVHG